MSPGVMCFSIVAGVRSHQCIPTELDQFATGLNWIVSAFVLLKRLYFQFCFMIIILLYILAFMNFASLTSNRMNKRKMEPDLFNLIRTKPGEFIDLQKKHDCCGVKSGIDWYPQNKTEADMPFICPNITITEYGDKTSCRRAIELTYDDSFNKLIVFFSVHITLCCVFIVIAHRVYSVQRRITTFNKAYIQYLSEYKNRGSQSVDSHHTQS